ncbi:hypothetical protein Mgra_00008079 [Meloidogyne graminicola]|uniref:TIL domain-containing protein n=1 Tax=Meloidogyne graminicola TaxID=189291 RepID=A0A8S9ZGW3_9BILA|nr:hypothetical protein Mgra_00008079 [Meloidogyne graminicola]
MKIKSKFVIILFALTIILLIEKSFANESEEERSCPVCEATCQNPVIHICPLFCTKIPKCLCKAGYARVEKGKCIPISECPKESTTILPTKPTHIYPQLCCNPFLPCRICPQGQHCVGNPGERRCVSNVCNLLCRIGFECKIINNKPICIPKCNKGEELKECANLVNACLVIHEIQMVFVFQRNECPTDQPKYCNKNCGFDSDF